MTIEPIHEIELLNRIGDGDQTALSELYDRYARLIYAFAYKILGSVEEAEEIVLDVFSQVWKNPQSYNAKRGRIETWLFVMARSRSLDRLRRLKKMPESTQIDLSKLLTNATSQPLEQALQQEKRELVLAALEDLPTEQRQAIELAYFEGLSSTQIADRVGQPLGTIKTRIRLGLNKMRQFLANDR
jgi:RNA polymerase sigma-70 factor (ECF subfamily)